jgi:hypothetical protein
VHRPARLIRNPNALYQKGRLRNGDGLFLLNIDFELRSPSAWAILMYQHRQSIMESATQLAQRFREVTLNGKWIANTNFQDQLGQVDFGQAIRQIGSLNSIAQLTFHVNYYIAGVLQYFNGDELAIRDKFSFDMPEINSPQEWTDLVQEFSSNAEQFAQAVEKMPAERLEEAFVNEKYGSLRRNIEGMIEHCYYHLGQVSLIRKMVREE